MWIYLKSFFTDIRFFLYKKKRRLPIIIVSVFIINSFSGVSEVLVAQSVSSSKTISVDTQMVSPDWALAERALLKANGKAAKIYADRFIDKRGYMPITPGWGVGKGPDDIMEDICNWPLAHALGGANSIIKLWKKAWEGHIKQFSEAKVPEVDEAKNGIYYKEFITQFDWEHTSEGHGPFYFYGLSRPLDRRYLARMRRFAGFYMNEDPEAQNYDPKHKIIRSLFNGSLGPKLTPATVDDWDGPLPPGVDPNSSRRTRFRKATNIRGDQPLNLNSTMMAFHAYMLTHEKKYRNWILEYVNAWRDRIQANGGNIPSNIGLDGKIGGEWNGKWYGGVFGWNSPDEGNRNYVLRGPPAAFGAALLLTGDQGYTDILRGQIDNLYDAKKVEDGQILLPHYYGDKGWYGYYKLGEGPSGALGNLVNVLLDIYMWSLQPGDLARLPKEDWTGRSYEPAGGWLGYLRSGNPDYPLKAFQQGLKHIRQTVQRLKNAKKNARNLVLNPVSTSSLINLTMGADDPGGSTRGPVPLHAEVRYFDPIHRRAGLPQDVAALVKRIQPDSVELVLININPLKERTVTVQMGAYGENHANDITIDSHITSIDAPYFNVRLAPNAGTTLKISVRRYAHQPTLSFPWDRWWMAKKDTVTK